MTYEEITKRSADFEVRYRMLSREEGGRVSAPFQHYRCDWAYEGDEVFRTGIFMIWPEFIAPDGTVLPKGSQAELVGLATMWIVAPVLRGAVHQHRIQLGTRGFFMEGSRKVAEAEVTRIIGLHSNPTTD